MCTSIRALATLLRVLLLLAGPVLVGPARLAAIVAVRSTVALAIFAMIRAPAASPALLARAAILPEVAVAAATIFE